MADFEVFSRALISLKRDPTVTIQKNGIISLNKTAHGALGAPSSVELLFDTHERTIGLRGVAAGADTAYSVRSATGTDAGPFVISAMAFLRFYDLQLAVSRRWSAYLDGEVLCIDVDDTSEIVTSNRAKKRPSAPHA